MQRPQVPIEAIKNPRLPMELVGTNDLRPQFPHLAPVPKVSKMAKMAREWTAETKRLEAEDLYFEKLRQQQNASASSQPLQINRIHATNAPTREAHENVLGGGTTIINNYHPAPPQAGETPPPKPVMMTSATNTEPDIDEAVAMATDAPAPQIVHNHHYYHQNDVHQTLIQNENINQTLAYQHTDVYQQFNTQQNIHNTQVNNTAVLNQLNAQINQTVNVQAMELDDDPTGAEASTQGRLTNQERQMIEDRPNNSNALVVQTQSGALIPLPASGGGGGGRRRSSTPAVPNAPIPVVRDDGIRVRPGPSEIVYEGRRVRRTVPISEIRRNRRDDMILDSSAAPPYTAPFNMSDILDDGLPSYGEGSGLQVHDVPDLNFGAIVIPNSGAAAASPQPRRRRSSARTPQTPAPAYEDNAPRVRIEQSALPYTTGRLGTSRIPSGARINAPPTPMTPMMPELPSLGEFPMYTHQTTPIRGTKRLHTNPQAGSIKRQRIRR